MREHLEQVALAGELGLTSVWAGQHFLSQPFAMFQNATLLGPLAVQTGGMTIGAGILLLPLLNRLEVAESAATLGAIRDGPFVLGVGFGYRDVANAAFGVTGSRVGTFDAKLDVVLRPLTGEQVTATAPATPCRMPSSPCVQSGRPQSGWRRTGAARSPAARVEPTRG